MASRTIHVYYAPLHGIGILPYDTPGQIAVGRLEEDSTWELTPNYAGPAYDLRFLDCHVKLTAIDMEARAKQPVIAVRDKRGYEQYNGKKVGVGVFCGSGGFRLENFRYAFYPNFLTKRGMRWAHQFTGIVKGIEWQVFKDEGWSAFLSSFSPEVLDWGSDMQTLIRAS